MTEDEIKCMIELHKKQMDRIDANMRGTSGHVRDAYEATYDKHLKDVFKLNEELRQLKKGKKTK